MDNSESQTQTDPIVKEAMERFDRAKKWESEARKNWLNDYKFANADSVNGYQWPDELRRNRDLDARPCLTINKTRQHCLQIINDAKQNKPAIKIRGTGNGASAQSALAYNALTRHIEYRSKASTFYDQAMGFQVQAGVGYLRVITRYVSEDTFDQEALIQGIPNPLMVYTDPDAKEPDKSDMKFAFVFEDIQKKEFEKKYPEYKNALEKAGTDTIGDEYGWMREDYIRVAEYYRVVYKKDVLYSYLNANGKPEYIKKSTFKGAPELLDELLQTPNIQEKDILDPKVEWYFIIGQKRVDKKDWVGKYIPIVPMIGEETVIDGIMDRKGHARALRDPQRMLNYWAPLSLNTPLPTPDGWTTMGDVNTGDWLLDEKGQPVQVAGVSPVHLHRQCYQVEFDDGTHIIADAEHKWTVEERGKRKTAGTEWHNKTITTKELTPKKHFIYTAAPLALPAADLPVHPYLLGAWLGDGDSNEIRITSGKGDIDNMRDNLAKCGYAVGLPNMKEKNSSGTLPVYNVKQLFRDLGVIGNKHIPARYLRASKEQREQLLMGLMDTDGAFAVTSRSCDFTTASARLAEDFAELLRSLGIKATYCMRPAKRKMFPSGNSYDCAPYFQFYFTADPTMNVFKLDRKRNLQMQVREIQKRSTKRHRIVSVKEVASVPVKCVGINSESHLFLAGAGMVPTHNSAAVEYGALQSKSPYIGSAESIEGYENMWNNANKANYSVLLYNGLDDAGNKIEPPRRQEPPVASPVALQGMQTAQSDMAVVSGQYGPNMGEPGNERTGKALNERQRMGDNATYHFIDQQAVAVRQIGRILVDIIPKVYDTPRILQIMDEDGTELQLMIDPRQQQAYQQQLTIDQKVVAHILNPAVGLYEVEADVGPDYGTKRQESVEAFKLILTQAPQLTNLIGDLLLQASDFNLASQAAQRLRRMVPPQALGEGPTITEQQLTQQNQQLTQMLQKMMEDLTNEKTKVRDHAMKRDVDIYNALTQRLKVFFDAKAKEAAEITPDEVQTVLTQAISEALGNSLKDASAVATTQEQMGETGPNGATPLKTHLPPGVRMGADGHEYMRDFSQSSNYRPVS